MQLESFAHWPPGAGISPHRRSINVLDLPEMPGTWMQMLALTRPARRWEPKRLRLRIFSAAGRIVWRLRLRLQARWPWSPLITAAITRLHAFAPS